MRCLTVLVVTNMPMKTLKLLRERFGSDATVEAFISDPLSLRRCRAGHKTKVRILVMRWRPTLLCRDGFYLTWAHKKRFRSAMASGHFSHLLYLEDDLRLTATSLRYWLEHRKSLARMGMLPGFVRYEHFRGGDFVVDQTIRQAASACTKGVTTGSDRPRGNEQLPCS